jgi:hypothetical protein
MSRLNRFDIPAVERARGEFAALARGVATGKVELLEGSRRLVALGHELGVEVDDPDFRTLVAFDSETLDVPIGPERKRWAAAALAVKDQQRAEIEAVWSERVLSACSRLVERFSPAP